MIYSNFRYKNHDTPMHRIDSRVKIIVIAGISTVLLSAGFEVIFIVGISIILASIIGKVRLDACFWEIKPILVLFLFILLTHTIFASGKSFLDIGIVKLSVYGLIYGLKVVSRLALIISMGFIYSASTHPEETRLAVEWFLRPFPIDEKVLGTTASLGIRFFPLIVEEAKKTREAEKVRCLDLSNNPFRRIRNMIIPFLIRGVRNAEKLSEGLKARCYSADRTSMIELEAGFASYIVLFSVITFALFFHIFRIF